MRLQKIELTKPSGALVKWVRYGMSVADAKAHRDMAVSKHGANPKDFKINVYNVGSDKGSMNEFINELSQLGDEFVATTGAKLGL